MPYAKKPAYGAAVPAKHQRKPAAPLRRGERAPHPAVP